MHLGDAGAAVEAALPRGRLSQIRITALPPNADGHHGADACSRWSPGPDWPRRCRPWAVRPVLAGDRTTIVADLTAAAEQGCTELVILPNDMETLEVAGHLASEMRRQGRRVAVIPTVAQMQGLAAMAVHEPTADFDSVVVTMSSAAGHARHAAVTIAESPAMTMAGRCETGDVLGLVEGDFVEIGDSVPEVAWSVVQRLLTAGGELLTLVGGADGRAGAGRRAGRADPHPVAGDRRRGAGRRAVALPAADRAGMTLRLAPSPWRTDTFRRLNNRLENVVGAKTAKQFEPLKVWTVGDLMRHLPRRYFSGTELSDLSQLREGEEVTVLAEVVDARVFNVYDRSKKARLEATITDRRGSLVLTFFGQPRLITYWQNALQPGARGIFAGKVKEFNRKLQLAHPDFVILDADGAIIGGAARNTALVRAAQTPVDRALPVDRQAPHLDGRGVRGAGPGLAAGSGRPAAELGPGRGRGDRPGDRVPGCSSAGRSRRHRAGPRPDAVRRGVRAAADHGLPAGRCRQSWRGAPRPPDRRPAGRLRRAAAVRADPRARSRSASRSWPRSPGRTRCSGCCRARSARARPWSRCGRCWRWSTPAARPRCWRRPRCWPPSTSRRSAGCSGDLADGGTLGAAEHATGVALITGSMGGRPEARGHAAGRLRARPAS